MKHYKTPTGQVYAYDADGSQDHLIAIAIENGMVPMTAAEVKAHKTPKPDKAQEAKTLEMQITPYMLAQAILSGDTTVLASLVQKIDKLKK